MAEASMLNWVGVPSHRSLRIEKIENGFIVKGKFMTKRKRPTPLMEEDSEDIRTMVEKSFCAYTAEEMLDMVQQYFGASADELKT